MTDEIRIYRFGLYPHSIFSQLTYGSFRCFLVERPWVKNKPFVSCIPEGIYTLEPHSSTKYPDTWALIGDTVSHYEEPGKPRYTCLWHVANRAVEVHGCQGPGLSIAFLAGEPAVISSGIAMQRLRKRIKAAAELPRVVISTPDGIEHHDPHWRPNV